MDLVRGITLAFGEIIMGNEKKNTIGLFAVAIAFLAFFIYAMSSFTNSDSTNKSFANFGNLTPHAKAK